MEDDEIPSNLPPITTLYDKVGIFSIGQKIGKGSSGEIYNGINMNTKEKVALKFEIKGNNPAAIPLLMYEYKLYKHLGYSELLPAIHYFGNLEHHYVLVMDLLGPSLEDLFNMSSRKLSIVTVAFLAVQMISCIEHLHENDYIHRDIKPDNFMVRNMDQVVIIDFGLSKRYRDRAGNHIPFKNGKSFIGTVRYSSINNHLGYEQSRRDDLESIGHILIYFLKSHLPWQGIVCNTRQERYDQILKVKQDTSLDLLCEGLPPQFKEFLVYCRNMEFLDTPDYKYLKSLFVPFYENYDKDKVKKVPSMNEERTPLKRENHPMIPTGIKDSLAPLLEDRTLVSPKSAEVNANMIQVDNKRGMSAFAQAVGSPDSAGIIKRPPLINIHEDAHNDDDAPIAPFSPLTKMPLSPSSVRRINSTFPGTPINFDMTPSGKKNSGKVFTFSKSASPSQVQINGLPSLIQVRTIEKIEEERNEDLVQQAPPAELKSPEQNNNNNNAANIKAKDPTPTKDSTSCLSCFQ